MTFEEYRQYEAPLGRRDELVNGEVILSPSPNRRHQDLCLAIYKLLDALVSPDYLVRLDTTVKLGDTEGPRPDVFVIDRERWVASDAHGGYPAGSPQLVIEVKSESNTWPEMEKKRDLFLSSSDCLGVLIVDPVERRVHCYTGSKQEIFMSGQEILLPARIGAGSIRVSEIFKGIVQ
jgi:Uma2 family endonuclease